MSNSTKKKRKGNNGRAMMDEDSTHDVNHDGGFLSSLFGYFSGRGDDAPSGNQINEQFVLQTLSHMKKMEQMMMGIGEKLATMSSLESRCNELEAKCSSLESKLESTSQSVKDHIDSKFDSMDNNLDHQRCNSLENKLEGEMDSLDAKVDSPLKYREYNTMLLSKVDHKVDSLDAKVDRAIKYHEYNTMLARNQSWQYSAVVHSYDWLDDDYEADCLVRSAEELKEKTIAMRRGEFPDVVDENEKGVYFYMGGVSAEHVDEKFRAHWEEFAAALKQFTPAMNLLPDSCDSYFTFDEPVMDSDVIKLLKEALMGKPFSDMVFSHNTSTNVDFESGGMSMDVILDIVHSNKHLRGLGIHRNRILSNHIDRLCSVAHNYPLVELDLWNSIDNPGVGDAMLTSLLTNGDLKLEKLGVAKCNITSDVITVLSDFIASNPRLRELNLKDNDLNDNDAAQIANALRSNTTLRQLELGGNHDLTRSGFGAAFRPVLCDRSSLNAVADSNHCCIPETYRIKFKENLSELMEHNRGRKIYTLFADRHKTMTNVQYFSDIDVNILPNMLEAVQKYQMYERSWNEVRGIYVSSISSLSIVYEVMRNWDKVVPLYE